jgi:myo-inositol-1-phosphate synthase
MAAQEIRIAIAGIGNCASALLQGLCYYRKLRGKVSGLMHAEIGRYKISDIKPVAAFDVDARKVGFELAKAAFAPPNCMKVFYASLPPFGVRVEPGPVLDGVANHMVDDPPERHLVLTDKEPVDVAIRLRKTKTDILINYLPVGSEAATRFYAQAALEAGCGFINCTLVFIASDKVWATKFKAAGVPVCGDDVKSQIGATIIHRTLVKLFVDRGVKIDRTHQLNFGGNTDFLNMLDRTRMCNKKISKTEAVQSQLDVPLTETNIHIGPSNYIPWLLDNKMAFIRIEGKKFGDMPVTLDCRLSVEDSPNSAGCVIDAIRCVKLALDRRIAGALISASAYLMKRPPQQMPDSIAQQHLEEFITGRRAV